MSRPHLRLLLFGSQSSGFYQISSTPMAFYLYLIVYGSRPKCCMRACVRLFALPPFLDRRRRRRLDLLPTASDMDAEPYAWARPKAHLSRQFMETRTTISSYICGTKIVLIP